MTKLFIVFLVFAAHQSMAQKIITGFTESSSAEESKAEQRFDSYLNAARIGSVIKQLSAKPHHVGSAADKANAETILNKFKSWGYDAQIETFYVLFPTPKTRLLEMNGDKPFKASLKEPALKEDATSGQQAEQLPVYNCYSPDGDVSGELVYVNYGVPADYEVLARMGIDVKGKIVIARYGHSWRGIKPKVAQEHGAIGCIIYSDPRDDGYYQGDVYPKGPYRPEYGAQRGSVADLPIYQGDPLTPGYASTKDAKRLDRKDAKNLLKIPVIPIGYADAKPLLESLDGPVVPEGWRGALPVTYHAGPGKNRVHLKLEFNWDIKPVNDVIAKMKGSDFPDEWIVRGNHHDAWVNGAADPISGQAAMLEEAGAVGEMVKTGWKPKRTIIYCAWDGEEEGCLGSTEWVEYHADELKQKAVVYINSDGNGRGFLEAGGSHALEPMFTEIAKDVNDPQTNVSVFERRHANEIINASSIRAKKELLSKKTITLSALGSGSDYGSFLDVAGVPSLNIGFGGDDDGGEYHSIYDSYDLYKRFKDPDFVYGVALAKVGGRTVLRFADAEILPFDYRSLQKTISKYTTELMMLADSMREKTTVENQLIKERYYTLANKVSEPMLPPLPTDEVPYMDFSLIQNALTALDKVTAKLAADLAANLNAPGKLRLNETLYKAEQQLLSKEGLPRRGWYKHSLYAPGFYTGYGVKTMPGIREAIEQRNWKEAQEQIKIVADAVNRLSGYLGSIN